MDLKNRVSQKAFDSVKKLEAEIEKVVAADWVREPKLTAEEKQIVVGHEQVVTQYAPLQVKYGKQYEDAQARLAELRRIYPGLILDGKETPESVANDLVYLPVLVDVLSDVYQNAMRSVNTANGQINMIKEKARERELVRFEND